jgi:molybdate transport system substrate-binding protein
MKRISLLFVLFGLITTCIAPVAKADQLSIAAAADLKFAMDEIVSGFRREHPGDTVVVTYGSSGKFFAQIQQGAPFDIYFSADISYPEKLAAEGYAASAVQPYATGRLVLWSSELDASTMTLASLDKPGISRIAIANPQHAPYGKRAEEALRATGLWDKLQSKLVYGENIAQTAQFVQSGNARIGIIALSLALNPELSKRGGYYLVPEKLHRPLEQGFIITKAGADKPLAKTFAIFMKAKKTRSIMSKYGFVLPGEPAGR